MQEMSLDVIMENGEYKMKSIYEKSRNHRFSQRCYKIPKNNLNIFLTKANNGYSDVMHAEVEYIFDRGDFYDVVVAEFGGHCEYDMCQLVKLEKKLNEVIN